MYPFLLLLPKTQLCCYCCNLHGAFLMKVCVAYLGMKNPYIGDGIGSIKSACVCVSEWVRERE